MSPAHAREVAFGQRFEFRKNWTRFLENLDSKQIERAKQPLRQILKVSDISGKRCMDIGSGSGLLSLVARRLGASVRPVDYDPNPVACTSELRRLFFSEQEPSWEIHEGSAQGWRFVSINEEQCTPAAAD